MNRRVSRTLGGLLSLSLFVAACTLPGGPEDSPKNSRSRSGMINVEEQANTEPVSGGTLNVSLYSFPESLDPAETYGTIATSGIPMAAIYDVLMRYDPDTGKYEP